VTTDSLLDLSPHRAVEAAIDLADASDRTREPDPIDPATADNEWHYALGAGGARHDYPYRTANKES